MSAQKFEIVLHKAAAAEIHALPAKERALVRRTIDDLVENPVPVGAMRLRGRENAYRIRLGNYRILYEVHAIEIVIYVFGVAHRKEVYLRLLRRR